MVSREYIVLIYWLNMKNSERVLSAFFFLISLATGGFFVYAATTRPLTNLESVLFQLFTLVTGLIGSFFFGRQSAREAAREIIRPHARSAFRRLVSLYHSLSRVAYVIESPQNSESPKDCQVILAKLEAIVVEQLTAADDALKDWRDIVPEDVEELYAKDSPLAAQRGVDNECTDSWKSRADS